MTERKTTLCIKSAPTLATCSYDQYGQIFIIFGKHKQHQHTFGNDMHIQLDLHFHYYLFYFLLNSCDGNQAK